MFLGAFNDNLFKNALIVLATFHPAYHGALSPSVLAALASGLFVLPFFLCSATAGQVADRYDKARVTRLLKWTELGIVLLAAAGFYLAHLWLLLFALACIGMQAAFFGPIKYSILPEHLHRGELLSGNALVEAGTFLAILSGTIVGGLIVSVEHGVEMLAALMFAVSAAGIAASRWVAETRPSSPDLQIQRNILVSTVRMLRYIQDNLRDVLNIAVFAPLPPFASGGADAAPCLKNGHGVHEEYTASHFEFPPTPEMRAVYARENRVVFRSLLGIAWFWFLGASFISLFPAFTRLHIGGGEEVVTLFFSAFSIGIGAGALLCGRFMRERIHARHAPRLLLVICLCVLAVAALSGEADMSWKSPDALLGVREFFARSDRVALFCVLTLMACCSGFFTVPLFALMQERSAPSHRARVIAASNLMDALFMLGSSLLTLVLIGGMGASIPQFFLVLGLLCRPVAWGLRALRND
jgi:MFS family permease